MASKTAKFHMRDQFVAFLRSHDVPRAHGNYVTWMNRAATRLNLFIGPADLANDTDIEMLMQRLRSGAADEASFPLLKNPLDESNLRSVFKKYVEMVQTSLLYSRPTLHKIP